MSLIANASFQFSLEQAFIAVNNGDGTFGTAVQVPSAKTLTLNVEYIKDRSEGNSVLTALASQIIAVGWTLDGANLNDAILQILTGVTPTSSNTGVNQVDTIQFSNDLMPYFGLIGQAWGQAGDDLCILLPKTKMMDGWSYKMDFGKFIYPQFKGTCIKDATLAYMLNHKNHATKVTTPAFPPSWV